MKSSWKIGSVAGIELRLHLTFPLLLLWVGASYYALRQDWNDVLSGIAFTLLLFVIIVLHELGHALTARRFGVGTRDITLLPIGGVARLDRIPEKPREELLVALAGPAVNVVLAAIIFLVLLATSSARSMADVDFLRGDLLSRLLWVNLFIVGFNMLPAFPMDGGRVLRALLAMRMDYLRATRIAAGIGQMMAWGLGIVGLFSNPFLIIIAMFVWMGAAQESGAAQLKSTLTGVRVRDVMMTEFRTLTASCTLGRAVEHVLAGFQQDLPVVENDRPIGLLTRTRLLAALADQGRDASVARAMQTDIDTAESTEAVEEALARLRDDGSRTILVVRDGLLIGILSPENLGEFVMIQNALTGARRDVRV